MAKVNNNELESQNIGKLLRIGIDSTLSFEYPINKICKKACQKLSSFACQNIYINGFWKAQNDNESSYYI